jgi:transcriptional regulator with XRE-family HTH domain
MTPRASVLGDFLRARREHLCPDDVGLTAGARRRVAGLRREEVAMLAGISSAYYLRLEQGRDAHPSGQVVEALARALRLDHKATEYLHRLASATPNRRAEHEGEAVAETLKQLINQLATPAVVGNRYSDVLTANACACAFCPGLAPGANLLCWIFLDPAARDFYRDWESSTETAVSELREVAGPDLDEARMRVLIDDLSRASEHFRKLWARAEVGYRQGAVPIRHIQLGDLNLYRTRLSVPHSNGQHVLIYHAEPGSQSAKALADLPSLST